MRQLDAWFEDVVDDGGVGVIVVWVDSFVVHCVVIAVVFCVGFLKVVANYVTPPRSFLNIGNLWHSETNDVLCLLMDVMILTLALMMPFLVQICTDARGS